jgi:hypothetical protein
MKASNKLTFVRVYAGFDCARPNLEVRSTTLFGILTVQDADPVVRMADSLSLLKRAPV